MGTFAVVDGQMDELARVYESECVPIVRGEPGNVDCYLLEPVLAGEPAVACTLWRTEAHAQRYEASGRAQEVVALVRRFFAGPPTLRAYHSRHGSSD
jgi:heme-degrading monooxygenase HmoA